MGLHKGALKNCNIAQVALYLAQGTVGLLIKEFHLICARAGLFVGHTPRNLSVTKKAVRDMAMTVIKCKQ